MPSYYESLSIVALEAWALGRPVLANGRCDVLKGQCLRSNAGCSTRTSTSSPKGCRGSAGDRTSAGAGRNGCAYFHAHYAWPVWSDSTSTCSPPVARDADAGRAARRAAARLVARRKTELKPAEYVLESIPRGRRDDHEASGSPGPCTLGYGDAIGHEVLGINRVLRDAGTSPRSSSTRWTAARAPDARLS